MSAVIEIKKDPDAMVSVDFETVTKLSTEKLQLGNSEVKEDASGEILEHEQVKSEVYDYQNNLGHDLIDPLNLLQENFAIGETKQNISLVHTAIKEESLNYKCEATNAVSKEANSELEFDESTKLADPHKDLDQKETLVSKKKSIKKRNKKIDSKHAEKNKPFSCDECWKSFKYLSYLNKHKVTHKKILECSICEKKFKGACGLKYHTKNVHTELGLLSCVVCQMQFKHKGNLIEHQLFHHNIFPFICSICDKGFKDAKKLAEHQLLHNDHNSFSCDPCEKKFVCWRHLEEHTLSVHGFTKSHKCQVCDQVFTIMTDLGHRNLAQYR